MPFPLRLFSMQLFSIRDRERYTHGEIADRQEILKNKPPAFFSIPELSSLLAHPLSCLSIFFFRQLILRSYSSIFLVTHLPLRTVVVEWIDHSPFRFHAWPWIRARSTRPWYESVLAYFQVYIAAGEFLLSSSSDRISTASTKQSHKQARRSYLFFLFFFLLFSNAAAELRELSSFDFLAFSRPPKLLCFSECLDFLPALLLDIFGIAHSTTPQRIETLGGI